VKNIIIIIFTGTVFKELYGNNDSVNGKITDVALQTNAIKKIFTNGKSRNLVLIPNGFKNGIGYKIEIKPIIIKIIMV